MKKPLYKTIASLVQARLNCQQSNNKEWEEKHSERLELIEKSLLPSGSGIDRGTKIDLEKSHGNKVVLIVDYHHMDENGYYDGWTSHEITIRPSLLFDFDLSIGGRNRNEIKDYLAEVYQYCLSREVEETKDSIFFVVKSPA